MPNDRIEHMEGSAMTMLKLDLSGPGMGAGTNAAIQLSALARDQFDQEQLFDFLVGLITGVGSAIAIYSTAEIASEVIHRAASSILIAARQDRSYN
jgi:hypothetical protein